MNTELCPNHAEMAQRFLAKARCSAQIATRLGNSPRGNAMREDAEAYFRIAHKLAAQANLILRRSR